MSVQICYCFGFTDSDIEADVIANNGDSTILKRIKAEKQNGTCRCHQAHPSGKWCLGDAHRVVDRTKKKMA